MIVKVVSQLMENLSTISWEPQHSASIQLYMMFDPKAPLEKVCLLGCGVPTGKCILVFQYFKLRQSNFSVDILHFYC
jgi:Zn-dependent alcohol dehydrogenase